MGLLSFFHKQPTNNEEIQETEDVLKDLDGNIIDDPAGEGATEEELQQFRDKLFDLSLSYCSSPERNYLTNIQRDVMTKEEFFEKMEKFLFTQTKNNDVVKGVIDDLERYIWGYYVIDKFLYDDDISDVKILKWDNTRIKKKGKRFSTGVKFKNETDYKRFVDLVCARNKVTLSDMNAIIKFTDTKSNPTARLRFNITGGYINSTEGPYVCIRKILKNKKTFESLIQTDPKNKNLIPAELSEYLQVQARESTGIIFTGKGASGKTTLMNAMLDKIPENKAALVIQEADELFSNHPEMMFQHVVDNRNESKVKYELKDEATNGLLTDLDYFIIGEIKGDEAAYFMNAAYTGHKCWASVHGVNSQEAMIKLSDYIQHATDYSKTDVLHMLRYMKVVIFMKDYRIDEISEIVGVKEDGELKYNLVFKDGEVPYAG